MIRWFANNNIAANFLMIGIVLAGVHTALTRIPLEVRPAREFNSIYISMEYNGGTARDVERAVLIPIEEAIRDLNGIQTVNAESWRGRGRLWVEAEEDANLRELLEEVKSRIDGITTFPSETEQPRVGIPDSSHWYEVLSVAVTGNLKEDELRRIAQRVQEDLTEIDGISRVNLEGVRNYEIAVEADQSKLASYNLGFRDLSDAIRRFSLDLPAGSIQSSSGTLTVRTRGQAYTEEEFAKIPIRAANGAQVLLGEVADINDGMDEGRMITKFNGEHTMIIEVMRTGKESAIEISNKVQEYVRNASSRFPEGINLYIWNDESISIRGRLGTLASSLFQGSLLVFILLGLFLRPMLAFWVVIGIPVCFAGGVLFMPFFGITANVMSIFGFIIVLGLVVDDAIVTGENIYSKLRTGMNPLEASVIGAQEVTVPVTFGVLTTVVAFLPLAFFDGEWGGFAKQIPPVVAPVLLFSLIESKLILPAHLKYLKTGRNKFNFFSRLQKNIADGLEVFIAKVYQPTLNFAVGHRYLVISVFVGMGLLMAGYCQGGRLGFQSMPTVDRLSVRAYLDMPRDTTFKKTEDMMKRIVAAVDQLKTEFVDPGTGESLVRHVMELTGGHWIGGGYDKEEGLVSIEMMPPSERTEPGPKNSVVAKRWQEIIGPTPEVRSLRIRGDRSRSRDSQEEEPIEVELRGLGSTEKSDIAEAISDLLESYEGISDAWLHDSRGGDELEISLKPRAIELGLNQQSLAQQVRQAFYGEEAQRILRGRDEIRVMVRLPRADRESLHTLDQLNIRTADGTEVPLSTVANIAFVKAPSNIERIDGSEVIKIFAQPEDEDVDIVGIAAEVTPKIHEMVQQGDNLSFRFAGYIAEHEESKRRTLIGAIALFFALYALLAIPFKSMAQPIYVLIAVPFGVIGALLGHMLMDVTPSYLSIFGMLALAGVVVNDSLVMVDFVNRRVREQGITLLKAVTEVGGNRFRPIMLTSVTTFAGLVPLLMDRSIQAQFLIPMAISLGFGIIFATVITLYLIPCTLLLSQDIGIALRKFEAWYMRPFHDEDDTAAS